MSYTPYIIYTTFKTVEGEVKNKNIKILSEETYTKRMSAKNVDLLQQIADLFNTRFSNVILSEYIKCGFAYWKTFSYDKFFRETVLQEYIARDARKKRNPNEDLKTVLDSLKHIDMNLGMYLKKRNGDQLCIIEDYISNKIGSTIVVYCIWRNLFVPTDIEWEYLNVIHNNWPKFEKAVLKYAPMIDKWCKKIKGKKS